MGHLLQLIVKCTDDEARELLTGVLGFVAILGSYFLLMPLREETGISLGTDTLPTLFVASLVLTLFATPAASWFLRRASDCRQGMRDLYRTLAVLVLGFLALQLTTRHMSASALLPRAIRIAFYLFVSLMNLLGTSVFWARSVDVFPMEAGRRVFGVMGAGATLGQLLASLAVPHLLISSRLRSASGVSLLPLVGAAVLLECAARCAARYGPATPPSEVISPERGGDACLQGGGAGSMVAPLRHGLRLIRVSPYLQHLCLYLVLNYFVTSFFYFEKALVVSKAGGSAMRVVWFANINSVSAVAVLVLQLFATGHVLGSLSAQTALALTPAVTVSLMFGIAGRPTPRTVAIAEITRKILAYAVARPARELLFTVLTREEKYGAKIFIDTLVQRVGDVAAAGAFQAAVPAAGFGPSALALMCIPVSIVWTAVAWNLGGHQMSQTKRSIDVGKDGTLRSLGV